MAKDTMTSKIVNLIIYFFHFKAYVDTQQTLRDSTFKDKLLSDIANKV